MYSKDQLIAAVASELRFAKYPHHEARTVAIQFVGSYFDEIRSAANQAGKDELEYAADLALEAARIIKRAH